MARALDPETISGTWLRSHEEEDDPTQIVYRRPSFRFPPSRGREALRLSPDGTMVHAGIGPSDIAQPTEGRWRVEDSSLHFDFDGAAAPRTSQIVDASADRLVVKRSG